MRSIVVTGIGAVSAFGVGFDALVRGIFAGQSAIRPLELFALEGARSTLAAEVDRASLDAAIAPSPSLSRTDRMAIAAVREALAAARLTDVVRTGLIVGGSTAGMFETEELLAAFEGSLDETDKIRMQTHPLTATAAAVARSVGAFARTRTVCAACSSGAIAIALGALWLDANADLDAVVVGGADALCRLTYSGFGALSVLDPTPTRPFAADRAGLSLGEGAAFLVLERDAQAKTRGATALARLSGFGLGNDAHHITNPEPGGATAATIIRRALASSGRRPSEIDYVNAHGTGTPQNDLNEAIAIRAVLQSHRAPLSSSKAQIGHTLAASGALEAAISVAAVMRGEPAPHVPIGQDDPACDVDLARGPSKGGCATVLSTSFGFGGTGAALVFDADRDGAEEGVSLDEELWITGVAALARGEIVTDRELASTSLPIGQQGDHDPTASLDAARARRLDRAARLATALTGAALARADQRGDAPVDRAGVSVVTGAAFGNVDGCMKFMRRVLDKGAGLASPMDFPNLVPSSPASHAAIYLGLGGPAMSAPDGAASAESALATALDLLRVGSISAVVAGSVEEVSALASRVLEAAPGIDAVSAAGSALVVERASSACARGARPLVRVRRVGVESVDRSVVGGPIIVDRAAVCARLGLAPDASLAMGGLVLASVASAGAAPAYVVGGRYAFLFEACTP